MIMNEVGNNIIVGPTGVAEYVRIRGPRHEMCETQEGQKAS